MELNVLLASFSSNLSEWLNIKGMSQSSLAKESGIPQPMISKIISGKWNNVTLHTVQKLASTLGLSPELKLTELSKIKGKTTKLPNSVACFWDVDLKTIQLPLHATYVAQRIMNFGGRKEIHWLLNNLEAQTIQNVIRSSRNLTKKSANFWGVIFGVPKKEIKCLKTH